MSTPRKSVTAAAASSRSPATTITTSTKSVLPYGVGAGSQAVALQPANADDENEEECEFFDATSENFDTYQMTLHNALEEAKLAICYFFNNKFAEARSLLAPYTETSMYHCMGHAVFLFLEAILTFEQQHITAASTSLKNCLDLCQSHRRKTTLTQTIGNKFRKQNFSQLTDVEAHAELCSAEALLLKALLTFIEDETLSSLIRGGIRIRQCYNSYKDCAQILSQRQWQAESSRVHFESGVRMGMGTFNLMISLLPSRVIKILEFIGFSGNKETGLRDLHIGYELPGLRQVLCALTLLAYHLIVCFVLSHEEGDLEFCDSILKDQLERYPCGVWFLFFKGRLEFMKGNLDEAQYWYKKSWKSQNVWKQFHHLSFWELLWVNCLKLDWRESAVYATLLLENSKWSRTIYSYQKAVVMLMLEEPTTSELQTVQSLMRDAPRYKQRIAGKSLPLEKFVCKKVERFFAQKQTLCLPAIELMYIWNMFKIVKKNLQLAEGISDIVERELNKLNTKQSEDLFDVDNRALCYLLRGACYRYMNKNYLALQNLEEVVALQDSIKEDRYLVPYAFVEIGLVHVDEQHYDLAISIFEETKKKYTSYSLESRLHFRIHTALMELKEKQLKSNLK